MDWHRFYYPLLDKLSDGSLIQKWCARALQVFGVLAGLGGAYLVIETLRVSFQAPATEQTIGGIILAAVLLAAFAAVVQVFFYRAASVRTLGRSSFTVIPVFGILLRLVGEVYATLAVAVGVGGCIYLWMAKMSPFFILQDLPGILPVSSAEGTFLGGLTLLVTMLVIAVIALILFYFFAEALSALADVARNTRGILECLQASPVGEPGTPPPLSRESAVRGQAATIPIPPGPVQAAARAMVARCPRCQALLDPEAAFCESCGAKLT